MSGSGLGQLITFYWLVSCAVRLVGSAGICYSVVLGAQLVMTIISDKPSNSQNINIQLWQSFMVYDDAGFLLASSYWLLKVIFKHSNFILLTFKGLSLLHSDSETETWDMWRRRREREDKLMCHLAPTCLTACSVLRCSQSRSQPPLFSLGPFHTETFICMTWHHDIMTLVTFPLVYCDTWQMRCHVTWHDLCPHDTPPQGECHRPFVKHKTFQ